MTPYSGLSSRASKAYGGHLNKIPRDLAAQPLSIRIGGNIRDHKENFASQKRSFTCFAHSAFRMTGRCLCGGSNIVSTQTNLSSRASKAYGGYPYNEPRDLAAQPLSIRIGGNIRNHKVNFASQKRSFTCLARSAFRMTGWRGVRNGCAPCTLHYIIFPSCIFDSKKLSKSVGWNYAKN